jgi:oligoendopeptidase F
MHSYLSWQQQPVIYSDYSLFVAEVASNFHQALVRGHLLRTNPDPQFQLALLEEAFSNFQRYFFIMPTLARFELEMHQRVERGEGLTADADAAYGRARRRPRAYGIDPNRHGIIRRLGICRRLYVFAIGIAAAMRGQAHLRVPNAAGII